MNFFKDRRVQLTETEMMDLFNKEVIGNSGVGCDSIDLDAMVAKEESEPEREARIEKEKEWHNGWKEYLDYKYDLSEVDYSDSPELRATWMKVYDFLVSEIRSNGGFDSIRQQMRALIESGDFIENGLSPRTYMGFLGDDTLVFLCQAMSEVEYSRITEDDFKLLWKAGESIRSVIDKTVRDFIIGETIRYALSQGKFIDNKKPFLFSEFRTVSIGY